MTRTADQGRAGAWASLALSVLCFAAVPLFIRHLAVAQIDPWTVNGMRYGVASVFWLPYVLWHAKNSAIRPLLAAAIVPSAINLIGQILWGLTPYFATASEIGFVVRTSFLFTLLAGLIWLPAERPLARSTGFWAGVALSIVGVCIMYSGALSQVGGTGAAGLILILATALFWGAYSVSVARCLKGYSARLSFGVICSYTSAGLLIPMFIRGTPSTLLHANAKEIAILLVSGFVGIAFSHVLMYRAIHALGAITTSGSNLVMPFLTWLGAWLFLGETMSARQWQGGLIVVAGTLVLIAVQRRISRQASAAEPPAVDPVPGD
jgi:drug/metabolite transporter (DMT)-like permease